MSKQKLSDITTAFPEWYQDVIEQAELVDHSPTRGSFVIRPYGYALWERMVNHLDGKIKELGVENAYFPLLIPEEFLKREAKHVEGFAPEVAVVTHAGGKELDKPYVVRPTSETIVYHMFAKWITSWRDLPLKINQWANVVRWEMRTRAFLRTTEILWQEGHTAHVSEEEAVEMALSILKMYITFVEDYLAIPLISGEKSELERFAGAQATYTFEGIMPDGRALQMGTSHVLAQSFPAAFGVSFQDKDGLQKSPFCTSWGVTTRLIGALVMTHGDQNGLIMPPRIAPIQVALVPIYRSDEQKALVMQQAEQLANTCKNSGIRLIIDTDDTKTPGAKYFHWELRGVPLRLELGPRDCESGSAVIVNRITKEKAIVAFDQLPAVIIERLECIQQQLFERARQRRDQQISSADKIADVGPILKEHSNAYRMGWCGASDPCENSLKEWSASIRCLLKENEHTNCFACNKPSKYSVLIAKSY